MAFVIRDLFRAMPADWFAAAETNPDQPVDPADAKTELAEFEKRRKNEQKNDQLQILKD